MFKRLFGFFGYVHISEVALLNKQAVAAATPPVDHREVSKSKLIKALSSEKYKWRSIDRLKGITGLTESTLRGLLAEVGARSSYRDSDVFGLKTRVGESGLRRARY